MKILIIKIKSIGDVLLSTPLIKNLKLNYPNAKIDVLINKNCYEMLSLNPDVNEIICYDRKKIKSSNFMKKIYLELKLFFKIFNKKYDYAIQTSENQRGIILSYFAMVKNVFSYKPKSKFIKFMVDKIYEIDDKRSVIDMDLLALNCFKKNRIYEKKLYLYYDKFNITLPSNFIHIHPISSARYKEIEPKLWGEIINYLEDKNKDIIITAPNNEIQIVKEILKYCNKKPIVKSNLSLKQIAYINSYAKFYIGVDTSITHISSANNTPTICFFGASIALKWAPWENELERGFNQNKITQRVGKNTIILNKSYSCGGCNKKGCNNSGISKCLKELEFKDFKAIIDSYLIEFTL